MPSGQWQCQLENSLNFGKIFGFHLDKSLLYLGIKLNKEENHLYIKLEESSNFTQIIAISIT